MTKALTLQGAWLELAARAVRRAYPWYERVACRLFGYKVMRAGICGEIARMWLKGQITYEIRADIEQRLMDKRYSLKKKFF